MADDATLTKLLDTERAMRDRVLEDVRAGVIPSPRWPSLLEYHTAIVARVRYEMGPRCAPADPTVLR